MWWMQRHTPTGYVDGAAHSVSRPTHTMTALHPDVLGGTSWHQANSIPTEFAGP